MGDRTRELRDTLAQYMRGNGMKNTRQREAIFDIFLGVTDHVSIEDLLSRVQVRAPHVGYATVYRTMKLFLEAGVAAERRFNDGPARYEPAELDAHHDHLICNTCGHVFEFEDEVIERRQEVVAEGFGLRITTHRMNLYGECLNPVDCPNNVG